MLYCCAHWIFAGRYWIASYCLGEGKYISLVNAFYYFVLLLNFTICVFFAIEWGMNLNEYKLSYAMMVWI